MKEFEYKTRVYYAETDAAGIVYYANYFRFAEAARCEVFRDLGYGGAGLEGFEHARGFAVVEANAKYKAPARLDDELLIKTSVVELGGASMKMKQDIYRGEQLLVDISITLVCFNDDLKSTRIPQEIRDAFSK